MNKTAKTNIIEKNIEVLKSENITSKAEKAIRITNEMIEVLRTGQQHRGLPAVR